jgi:hypothetical protein
MPAAGGAPAFCSPLGCGAAALDRGLDAVEGALHQLSLGLRLYHLRPVANAPNEALSQHDGSPECINGEGALVQVAEAVGTAICSRATTGHVQRLATPAPYAAACACWAMPRTLVISESRSLSANGFDRYPFIPMAR